MGDKLFKTFLNEIGEYQDNMSLLDVLDKLEKLELIEDGSAWMEIRALRNKLTHEYLNSEQEIIDGIVLAISSFKTIEEILTSLKTYAIARLK